MSGRYYKEPIPLVCPDCGGPVETTGNVDGTATVTCKTDACATTDLTVQLIGDGDRTPTRKTADDKQDWSHLQ